MKAGCDRETQQLDIDGQFDVVEILGTRRLEGDALIDGPAAVRAFGVAWWGRRIPAHQAGAVSCTALRHGFASQCRNLSSLPFEASNGSGKIARREKLHSSTRPGCTRFNESTVAKGCLAYRCWGCLGRGCPAATSPKEWTCGMHRAGYRLPLRPDRVDRGHITRCLHHKWVGGVTWKLI